MRDADEVVRNWRRIKAEETARTPAAGGELAGALASIPAALPALARAQQIGEKLAHVGFDWPDVGGVLAKVDEERRELDEAHPPAATAPPPARELGDLLLTLASVARHLEVPAEMALRDATSRLGRRVEHVEAAARAAGRLARSPRRRRARSPVGGGQGVTPGP